MVSLGILVRLDGAAGRDLADHRQVVRVLARYLRDELRRQSDLEGRAGREAEGTRLRGAALEVALALEDREVVVDGRRGGEVDRTGDFAHGRRIPTGAERRGDVLDDALLAQCVVLRHLRLLRGHRTERLFDCQGLSAVLSAVASRRAGRSNCPLRVGPVGCG